MYNLFLDDVRVANKFLDDIRTWETVRNYNQFVEIIQNRGMPEFISFDHDLDEQFVNKTGFDCAKWLVEYCMRTSQPLPKYQVHSMNPVGKKNIECLLANYKKIENSADYE